MGMIFLCKVMKMILSSAVIAVQLCQYTKILWIVHLKQVCFISMWIISQYKKGILSYLQGKDGQQGSSQVHCEWL